MRVLLADDSVLMIERLREMLGNFHEVEIVDVCKNGADALIALRNLNPDLAIVDLKMPGLTGLQVLTEIRKENKNLPFILLTFHANDNYRRLAKAAGVNYFFSKVDDFEKVGQVVDELLNRNVN